MKTVKERDNGDLLKPTLQLHSRSLNFPSQEMHNAFMEARQELEFRLNPKEPEAVHGNGAEKEVCCPICGWSYDSEDHYEFCVKRKMMLG